MFFCTLARVQRVYARETRVFSRVNFLNVARHRVLSRIETNARVSVHFIIYRTVVHANDKGTVNTDRKKKRQCTRIVQRYSTSNG